MNKLCSSALCMCILYSFWVYRNYLKIHSVMVLLTSNDCHLFFKREHPLGNRTILYQMVALYDYNAQGPEDLEFSEGDTVDILSEGESWGRCANTAQPFSSSRHTTSSLFQSTRSGWRDGVEEALAFSPAALPTERTSDRFLFYEKEIQKSMNVNQRIVCSIIIHFCRLIWLCMEYCRDTETFK